MKCDEKLKFLPERIRDEEKAILQLQAEQDDLKTNLKAVELQMQLDIAEATNIEGKKSFTNETQRKAELIKRLDESPQVRENKEYLKGLERKIANAQVEVMFLKRQFSAAKLQCRIQMEGM